MKSTYNFLLILLSALLVSTTSCLKEEINDTPNPSLIQNEDDVTALLLGLYGRFNDGAAFKYEGVTMYLLAGDDMYSDGGSIFGAYSGKTFTDSHTGPMWNSMHATVASTNEVMATLDRLELDSAFEAQARGEAEFIRAFCYYYLVRLYGGVPLRTETVNYNSDFYKARNTVDEVYAQIFTDLKSAAEKLPLYSKLQGANLGRASKGAAQAILAQAYLTYGNQKSLKGQDAKEEYQKANFYADEVINSKQYSLLNNYADIFDINREVAAYDEVIFGVRFQTDPQNRALPASGSEFALHFAHDNTDGVTANGARGNGDANYKFMHWFADYYRTGDYVTGTTTKTYDYRNEAGFFQKGLNSNTNKGYAVYPNIPATNESTINMPMCSKYKDPNGKDMRNHGNDLFIIRFAEVYLIKAEALNELEGPSADALAAFNKVRERARKANGTARTVPANLTGATAQNKDVFRMKIFDERGLELLGEGQRWFDLVRMRSPLSPSQTMYEYQFLVRFADQTAYPRTRPTYNTTTKKWSNSNAVYEPGLRVQVPKHLLFPIPYNEITINPKFGQQNPGW